MGFSTVVNENTPSGGKELAVQSMPVPGGTLYVSTVREAGQDVVGVAQTFVPAASSAEFFLKLSDAKSDAGVPMTAAAGTPSGTVGISRTAGTSLVLVGETTSSSAKTNKAVFEFTMPANYIAGSPFSFVVNANYTGAGTPTAASCSVTPTLYTESNVGVEAASAGTTSPTAILITGTAADLVFTNPGTGIVPGQHLTLELVLLVTTSSGGLTGQINSVRFDIQSQAANAPITRYLKLTDAKSDLGVPMTATPGTPSGTVGISRTAGTSMVLTGEATSSNGKTNKAVFEFTLPDTYVIGNPVVFTVNTNYTTSGTVTAASTTMTAAVYAESNTGVEQTALGAITAAQQIGASAADLAFSLTSTGLTPGMHLVLELVMLVTTSAGAATGQINSVRFTA